MSDLQTYVPARNLGLQGTSSWINYFLNRDSRPGNDVISVGRLGVGRGFDAVKGSAESPHSDEPVGFDHKSGPH